ncbi:MAG: DNA-binding protein [Desulfobacterales bacterium]
MNPYYDPSLLAEWKCGKCDTALKPAKVDITYLESSFTIELPKCEICGLVLVPESLAMGKMVEVEKILEDK